MNRDQLTARLRATFLGELEEQVRTLNAEALALETDPRNPERLKSLFRIAHTLKGAAHAAGIPEVEQVCHSLESMLAAARDGQHVLGRDELDLLFAAADALADAGARLKAGGGLASSALARLSAVAPGPGRGRPPAPNRGEGQVRVQGDRLDDLLIASTGLVVAGDRSRSRAAEVGALHDSLARMTNEWRRRARGLRVGLERAGTSPVMLEAIQAMDAQLYQISHDTGRVAGRAAEDARVLSQATGDVAGQVRRLRLRPFAEACEALPRAVRDLGAAARKDVRLEVSGGELEVDRAVLDGLRESILHLVRNAVDHGVEAPETRVRAGKSRQGVITVAATLKGDRITVTVADDGAGIDVSAVRAELERRGLSVPSDSASIGRTLLEGGFSTRSEVTMVSGRGVGLDLVHTAVAKIRGRVDVSWVEGRGTTFTVECPFTLATIRAVLVSVGSQIVAIPTNHVERLVRVKPREIRHAGGRPVIAGDPPIPIISLARLLPPLVGRPEEDTMPAVVLRSGEQRVAVTVDEFLAEQEIVLRPVGREDQQLPRLMGAALLSSGKVALVINPATVVASGLSPDLAAEPATGIESDQPVRHRILVVDDSITTRTLEQSILEAAGYDVMTAVDGADAWRVLQEQRVELVVADIEMPRMDGLELCEAIRSSKRLKELPVVLVTALETAEQQARGLQVGADAYIGKSSFDQQNLLDTIRQLVG